MQLNLFDLYGGGLWLSFKCDENNLNYVKEKSKIYWPFFYWKDLSKKLAISLTLKPTLNCQILNLFNYSFCKIGKTNWNSLQWKGNVLF